MSSAGVGESAVVKNNYILYAFYCILNSRLAVARLWPHALSYSSDAATLLEVDNAAGCCTLASLVNPKTSAYKILTCLAAAVMPPHSLK
jgi:hypothetical protein